MSYLIRDFEYDPLETDDGPVRGIDFSDVLKNVDTNNRTITLIASTEDPDRDGDVILVKGWQLDNYVKNPVFLWAHQYHSVPLAKCIKIQRTANQLILTHKFPTIGLNPFADMIFNLYKEKVINAGSVGFISHKWEPITNDEGKFGGQKFIEQELLEHSGCAVPANPHALQNAIKAIPGGDKDILMASLLGQSNFSAQLGNEKDIQSELESIAAEGPELFDDTYGTRVQVPRGFNNNNKNKGLENMEIQKGFPLPNPDKKAIEPKDRLYFRDREGNEHKAITIKEKFADLVGDSSLDGQVSAGNIIRAHILGDFSDLNKTEKDLMLKQQQEGTGSLGGFVLPQPVSSQIIDLARNKMVTMQAGARTLKMDFPELTLVKVLSDPTAYWRAESEAITESEGSFEPLHLKVKVVGALIRVTMELLADAANAASTLENMMSASLALEQDRVSLLGTGVNEPLGLDTATGVEVISMGTNGATPRDYDEYSQAAQKVAENNGVAKAVIMAPRTYFTLDRLKEATTNAPLKPPASYEALRKLYTNQIPIDDTKGSASNCSKAYVGDFSNLLFGIRNDITIEASKSGGGSTGNDAFARMEVLIRAFLRMDIAITRENHFVKIEGIKP